MGGFITIEYYWYCQVLYQPLFLFTRRIDVKNGAPAQEPEKDVAHMREGDEFRDDGKRY